MGWPIAPHYEVLLLRLYDLKENYGRDPAGHLQTHRFLAATSFSFVHLSESCLFSSIDLVLLRTNSWRANSTTYGITVAMCVFKNNSFSLCLSRSAEEK